MNNLVVLTEVHKQEDVLPSSQIYSLDEIIINPAYVVYLKENIKIKQQIINHGWPEDLDKRISFTKIIFNSGGNYVSSKTVVGDVFTVAEKLKGKK